MEAAGLAVGAVSLATLFNNAVDCFRHIKVARSFGKNAGTYILKFDLAQLRLSRWGESIGLNRESLREAEELSTNIAVDAQSIKLAETLLGHIIMLFSEAEKEAERLKTTFSHTEAAEEELELTHGIKSLHQKMKVLSNKRQKAAGLRQKTEWALYREQQANSLLTDVSSLVKELTELFPDSSVPAQQIRQGEFAELLEAASPESLKALKHAAGNEDKELVSAISEVSR